MNREPKVLSSKEFEKELMLLPYKSEEQQKEVLTDLYWSVLHFPACRDNDLRQERLDREASKLRVPTEEIRRECIQRAKERKSL